MTQPQYAPQFPQMPQAPAPQPPQVDPAYLAQTQLYAQQPQQAYAPPQQPQYAPQMPQQPAVWPPQQAYPGYPMPQQPAPPQLAAGSLSQFFAQPAAGGGPALKFEVGTRIVGIVSRPLTDGDVQQQTQPGSGLPAFYKDGRPKFVMRVPVQVHPTPTIPDGQAQWYCAGQASTELQRAMAEAGAPEGPPEAGAVIDITCTHTRPSGQGMNPAKNYRIVYTRPNGAAPVAPPAPAPVAPPTPAQMPQQAPQQPPAAPPAQQAPQQAPQQAAPPVAQAPQQPPAAPPPVPAGAVEGLSPQQQALLAQLTGGQPQQAQA